MSFDPSVFIKAIDDQDIEKLGALIQSYPDANYNKITPNGASALWVALNPPSGKRISVNVIRFLLGYYKNNGELLVNPTQMYKGYTSYHYVRALGVDHFIQQNILSTPQEAQILLSLFRYAMNNYVEQGNANQQALAEMANNAQNVHNSYVSRLAKSNIQRLYQHYIIQQNKTLSVSAKETASNLLTAAIEKLKINPATRTQAEAMEQGLHFCMHSTTAFSLQLENNRTATLTLMQLLALLTYAINDVENIAVTARRETLDARIKGVLNTLYDNATAYGPNHHSCEGGAYNRFGFSLAALHPFVHCDSREPLTGTVALMEMNHFFKTPLEAIAINNLSSYWRVLRAQLIDNPCEEEDITHYKHFIDVNTVDWLNLLTKKHRVEKKTAEDYVQSLKECYPYHQHEPTWNLLVLLPLVGNRYDELLAKLTANHSIENARTEVTNLVATRLGQETSWTLLLSQYQLLPTNEFAIQFIKNYLTYARQQGVSTDLFKALFKPQMSSEAYLLAQKILFITAFQLQKIRMIESFPEQKQWLDRLTQVEIIDILLSLTKEQPQLPLNDIAQSLPHMIEIALKKGYIRNMSLKGMTFENRDWRGFVLDDVDLENSTFINCDLRLVSTQNAKLSNIRLEHCRLPYWNQNTTISGLQLNNLAAKLYQITEDPLSLYGLWTHPNCTASLVNQMDSKGDTPLLWATKKNRPGIVQAILANPHCLADTINKRDSAGYTAFTWAVEKGLAEIVELITRQRNFCTKLLNRQNSKKCSALYLAANYKHNAIAKIIVDNPHCDAVTIDQQNNEGETALICAVKTANFELMSLLMRHTHCSVKTLNLQNNAGETALFWAVKYNNLEAVRMLLRSRNCNANMLNLADLNGNTPLSYAAKNGQTAIVRAILESPHCSLKIIQQALTLYPVFMNSLQPQPLILNVCKELFYYKDSLYGIFSGYLGIRHHRNFIWDLLQKPEELTPRVLYTKMKEHADKNAIRSNGQFQIILTQLEQVLKDLDNPSYLKGPRSFAFLTLKSKEGSQGTAYRPMTRV